MAHRFHRPLARRTSASSAPLPVPCAAQAGCVCLGPVNTDPAENALPSVAAPGRPGVTAIQRHSGLNMGVRNTGGLPRVDLGRRQQQRLDAGNTRADSGRADVLSKLDELKWVARSRMSSRNLGPGGAADGCVVMQPHRRCRVRSCGQAAVATRRFAGRPIPITCGRSRPGRRPGHGAARSVALAA